MEWLADPQTWIAFVTLVALELVLGVDNVIFISILAGKLPANQQKRARQTERRYAVNKARRSRIRTYKIARGMNNMAFAYATTPLEMAESMAFNQDSLGCIKIP